MSGSASAPSVTPAKRWSAPPPRAGTEHTGQRVRKLPRQIGHSTGFRRSSAALVHSSSSITGCMAAYGSINISPNATRAGDTSRPNLGAMASSSVKDNAEPR